MLVYPVELEYRQAGRELNGRFPYGEIATIASRGRTRKETIRPRAFSFAVERPERDITLLHGHDFSQPLASRRAGTLDLSDTDEALEFSATLPVEGRRPSWIEDAVRAVEAGLIRGLSPGFQIPPRSALGRDPERLIPEPGNPSVEIREIVAAVLFELSLVSRPTYETTAVELRGDQLVRVLESALPDEGDDRDRALDRLASAAGISRSTVSQILRAEIDHPPPERLRGFASALGIPYSRLVDAVVRDGADRETYSTERRRVWL